MKITFKIDTEKESAFPLTHANDMWLALTTLREQFRSWVKYGDRNEIPVDEIQETFYDIIHRYNISGDELI